MDAYERAAAFCKYERLIRNRIKVINAVTNDRAEIELRRGRYRVSVLGSEVAAFGWYDVDSARAAYERLDTVFDVLWNCRRLGLAAF